MGGNGLPVVIVLIVALGISAATPFIVPRGINRNLIVSSVLMTLWCVYIMWAVTYMAQMNPLIVPHIPAPSGH